MGDVQEIPEGNTWIVEVWLVFVGVGSRSELNFLDAPKQPATALLYEVEDLKVQG